MTDPTGQIKVATGRQIYKFMRALEAKMKAKDTNPRLKVWFDQCYERAKELNRERFGDWEDAKRKLDSMSEPRVNYDHARVSLNLDNINGYPCQYSKEKTTGGVKSIVFITNGKTNSMYVRQLGEITVKIANKIFNG